MPEDSNEPAPPPALEDSPNEPETTPVERLIAREIESNPEPPNFVIRPARRKPGTFLVFAGVFLPSVAVFIELTMGLCANTFFDPLPTVWHKILVIATPLANLYVIRELRKDGAEYHCRLVGRNCSRAAMKSQRRHSYKSVVRREMISGASDTISLIFCSPGSFRFAFAALIRFPPRPEDFHSSRVALSVLSGC